MIKTFKDSRTLALNNGQFVKAVPADIAKRAIAKLFLIDTVTRIEDLRVPPGNRLHQLAGDRSGQWAIRVNEQWRICFIWRDGDAYDVEFTDYH